MAKSKLIREPYVYGCHICDKTLEPRRRRIKRRKEKLAWKKEFRNG